MTVNFYTPNRLLVPLSLALEVTTDEGKKIRVFYDSIDVEDDFLYCFKLYGCNTDQEEEEIINYLAQVMVDQSYTGPQKWQIESIFPPLNDYTTDMWAVIFKPID